MSAAARVSTAAAAVAAAAATATGCGASRRRRGRAIISAGGASMVSLGSVAAAHGSAATKATGGLSDGADNVRRGSILPLISARQNVSCRSFLF